MGLTERTWAFQLAGQDYLVQVRWSPFSEAGTVFVNGYVACEWGTQMFGFKSKRFSLAGHLAEVRPVSRTGMGMLTYVELYVDGVQAERLPPPNWHAPAQVVSQAPFTCHRCSAQAVMIVYATGACESVCPTCGRARL